MTRLHHITIYPIKSLPGVQVAAASLLASGALEGDRRWAIHDAAGNVVNAKRTAEIHRLRAIFSTDFESVEVSAAGSGATQQFHLASDRSKLEAWLAEFFGFSVTLTENREAGFPDDTEAPGPTVISTGTIAAVARWFPGLSDDEVRRRFRANLELDAAEPFWEDRLFAAAGQLLRFKIGEVLLAGTNPCQRCVVPTRDALSGEIYSGFQKTFAQRRERELPDWAATGRFNHFYRLSVNTRGVDCAGRPLHLGDDLQILDTVPA